jgi:molybdopterin-guanine dinucleotide biosynthesis protein A
VLESSQFLIDLTAHSAATDLKFVLAGILHGLAEANSTDVVFVPIDNNAELDKLFELMAEESIQQGLAIQKSSALSALSTAELLNVSTKNIVLVVTKHASRLTNLEESLSNLKQSGARVLGLLLVDSRI